MAGRFAQAQKQQRAIRTTRGEYARGDSAKGDSARSDSAKKIVGGVMII